MAIHAENLRRFLCESTGRFVRLRMNNNTHSVIRATRDGAGPGIRLSLHRMFLEADEPVLRALAQFIVAPTARERRIIREFIDMKQDLIAGPSPVRVRRPLKTRARGRVYNLEERARILNERHFGGRLKYRITWGRNIRAGRGQTHVTLGTWNDRQGIIRIHPMLDQECVPAYFVDYVIFHEMSHIAVPSRVDCGGRRQMHTPEFYAVERTYPLYALAMDWEKSLLPRLIRAWNGGPPLPPVSQEIFDAAV